MAGFNPLAALGANAVAATQQAIETSTLEIGVSAEILQAQLSVGNLIAATVLPPQGGSDLLQIFGQTVVAQLPTGVYPGETLLLAVTGFVGNSIMVQNLGIADPNAPLPTTVDLQFPVEEGAPQTATLTTGPAQPTPTQAAGSAAPASPSSVAPTAPSNTTPAANGPQPLQVPPSTTSAPPTGITARGSQPMAPSSAVFVAASVRPVAPQSSAPAAGSPPVPSEENDVEARIAAARTAAPDGVRASSQPPSQIVSRNSQRPPQMLPPTISRGLPQAPPIVRAAGAPTSAVAAAKSAVQSPEASLLSRLRVPVTAATTAAAKLMDRAAQAIPRTFSNLEAALARVATDPRVASLRSALGFTGRLDPSNARALPEQIAAFVNDVLDGAESKIASIVRALTEDPAASATATEADVADAAPGATLAAPDASASVQARVAERVAAMDYDVKAAILTLLQSPPSGASPQLTQALNEALTAINGLQLNALNAQNANPNTIAIQLPMFFREGGSPVQLNVDRDGAKGERLDAGNFHVAFVLDTESLGVVAIDLQASNRAVNIAVKTERSSAANEFRSSLDDLRGRLETLRYRVAGIGADVAPPRGVAPAPAPVAQAPVPENRAPSSLDLQA